MKTLLQINVTANWGSTGKIAEDIGRLAIENSFESWIGYGRGNPNSKSNLIRIGNDFDLKFHGIQTRLFDNHGLASKSVTRNFINKINDIKPDIIHLHNIHGYFLNYPLLFNYLKEWGGPVVWTLHDCWSFTGHCAHYTYAHCNKWQSHCEKCPQKKIYPASLFRDRSFNNFEDKKNSFLGLPNLTLVTVSNWLADQVSKSFLKDYPIKVIHNGVDLNIFKPVEKITKDYEKKLVLGIANVWSERKGLEEFKKLRTLLPSNYEILLIGLNKDQIKSLPIGIKGLQRTETVDELVNYYNMADVYVNPSVEETLGMTTIEAMACGTPVVVYNSTAVPEPVNENSGFVVDYKNINQLAKKIQFVCEEMPFTSSDCRARTEALFDKNNSFQDYINLYKNLTPPISQIAINEILNLLASFVFSERRVA